MSYWNGLDVQREELLKHCRSLDGADWDKFSTGVLEEVYIATKYARPKYDPDFGDDKICKCGHPYYRHFDPFENDDPVGCKYCDCGIFDLAEELDEQISEKQD